MFTTCFMHTLIVNFCAYIKAKQCSVIHLMRQSYAFILVTRSAPEMVGKLKDCPIGVADTEHLECLPDRSHNFEA